MWPRFGWGNLGRLVRFGGRAGKAPMWESRLQGLPVLPVGFLCPAHCDGWAGAGTGAVAGNAPPQAIDPAIDCHIEAVGLTHDIY